MLLRKSRSKLLRIVCQIVRWLKVRPLLKTLQKLMLEWKNKSKSLNLMMGLRLINKISHLLPKSCEK